MSTPVATLPPTALSIKERGNKAFSEGRFALAVNEYTDAIKLAPNYAPLYSNRAAAYLRLNQLPEALQDARKGTDIDERWAKGWMRLSEVMLAIGETETDPVGVKLLYEAVQEAYENAYGLLQGEGDSTINQREEIKRKMKVVRDQLVLM